MKNWLALNDRVALVVFGAMAGNPCLMQYKQNQYRFRPGPGLLMNEQLKIQLYIFYKPIKFVFQVLVTKSV